MMVATRRERRIAHLSRIYRTKWHRTGPLGKGPSDGHACARREAIVRKPPDRIVRRARVRAAGGAIGGSRTAPCGGGRPGEAHFPLPRRFGGEGRGRPSCRPRVRGGRLRWRPFSSTHMHRAQPAVDQVFAQPPLTHFALAPARRALSPRQCSAQGEGTLPLSPAPSGERAEAGALPAEGEGRRLLSAIFRRPTCIAPSRLLIKSSRSRPSRILLWRLRAGPFSPAEGEGRPLVRSMVSMVPGFSLAPWRGRRQAEARHRSPRGCHWHHPTTHHSHHTHTHPKLIHGSQPHAILLVFPARGRASKAFRVWQRNGRSGNYCGHAPHILGGRRDPCSETGGSLRFGNKPRRPRLKRVGAPPKSVRAMGWLWAT